MTAGQDDRLAIATVINGWMYRDGGDWERLRTLFHPDGTIAVTWFEGLFSDFVTASSRMGAGDLRTKHLIGTPVITLNGDRAVAETNAIIVGDNPRLDFGCSCHNRFLDLVERRQGEWKIFRRDSIYDMGTFLFPFGPVAVDTEAVRRHPRAYAPLAHLLERSGYPLQRVFATKGSDLERELRRKAAVWLAG
ncbi:MAG: nuclear transport factor 2 family protein [Planctomycetes bacterium]|nr:nuclear transport factor 2 family protein [Planctomycetota bacterium]